MKAENYFDNASTTPMDPRVVEAMLPYLRDDWGNANSIHAWGRSAMGAVERAQEQVAALLGAEDPQQVFFTSGATESNNWVLHLHASAAISPFEHSAMDEPARELGFEVLGNDGLAIEPPDRRYELISVMDVNNEIGARWGVSDLSDYADFLHSDITQAVGKLPVNLEPLAYASFSAHKFYGPKGVGGLYVRDAGPGPFILGGEQQYGARGGTLNVPGIVGMGEAARLATEEWEPNLQHATELRSILLEALGPSEDCQINGGKNVSPYILSLSFRGLEGETLVIEMDQRGYGISSGAACSSHSADPSHVLLALKMPEEWLRGTVRVSFGRLNTKESAQSLGKSLKEAAERLRKM